MRFTWFLLCLSGLLPFAAQAAIDAGNVSCSDSLVVDDAYAINLSCSGDLSFTDGVVSSDIGITLRATGTLLLGNLSLYAPVIELSGYSISLISDVTMTGTSIDIVSSNGIDINGKSMPIEDSGSMLVVAGYGLDRLDNNNLILNSVDPGTLQVRPGGNISLVARLPLPGSVFQLSLGLFTLLFPAMKRKQGV
ncbi:MAG: hypothetical protein M0R33_06605 [Methylomonas sp.]|jgi:hypothetical protein|uniref:hypothetical protein n=1 Tax=Methylomonas sp. TaxID=418 RepID=UPI0025D1F609|nr:hypothetical protein [Methylomonas sp.]MCK9606108.1 hypothetical protein [Methylomonas sp.]